MRQYETVHATVIAERAGLQVYEIAAVLSSLEMKNLVVRAGALRGNMKGKI